VHSSNNLASYSARIRLLSLLLLLLVQSINANKIILFNIFFKQKKPTKLRKKIIRKKNEFLIQIIFIIFNSISYLPKCKKQQQPKSILFKREQ
jgi:hypothetical protein